MQQLLVCTHNKGKLIEIKDLLSDLNMEVVSLDEVGINFDVEENGETYEENAILKASKYGKVSNLISLADDTGLEVRALDNAPGVHSKRFFKTSGEERNSELMEMLVGKSDRFAKFVASVAVYNPGDKSTRSFSGEVEGQIVDSQGNAHADLGYDSIFKITKLEKTFAQASLEEKNSISHRAVAVEKAKQYIKTLL